RDPVTEIAWSLMTGRIPILDVTPQVACGRYPAKAVVGERFAIEATVFREGHDAVAATAVLRDPRAHPHQVVHMHRTGPAHLDRWATEVQPDAVGDWTFEVQGWSDPIATWRHHAEIKIEAQIDTELVLTDGSTLLERAARSLPR